MAESMKVFFADGKGKGHFEIMAIPNLKEDEVLVKVCYCGICGTDQDLFSGNCSFAENGQVTYPDRLGHEWSGVVEAVGADVDGFKKGDRVVGDNTITCGECRECKEDKYDKCRYTKNVGTIDPVYDGAFAEYFVIPKRHIYKIPEGMTLMEAALAEPFSVAYGAIKKMEIDENSVVAVIGTGCIGMAAAVLAKACRAKRVFMIGRNPIKLEAAEKLGVETINVRKKEAVKEILNVAGGADFVIECSGASGTFLQSVEMAKRNAKIGLIGFYENLENNCNIDEIVSKALTIFGVMGEYGNMAGVLKMLGESKCDLTPIITGELDFDKCMDGFIRSNYPNAIKTMVKIGEE